MYLPMLGNCRGLVVSANGVGTYAITTASSSVLDLVEDRTETCRTGILSVDEETGCRLTSSCA